MFFCPTHHLCQGKEKKHSSDDSKYPTRQIKTGAEYSANDHAHIGDDITEWKKAESVFNDDATWHENSKCT